MGSSTQLLLQHRARATVAARHAEIEHDVAPYRDLSPAERDVLLQQVVRATHQLLTDQPRARVQEPPAPDLAAAWARLHARRHRHA